MPYTCAHALARASCTCQHKLDEPPSSSCKNSLSNNIIDHIPDRLVGAIALESGNDISLDFQLQLQTYVMARMLTILILTSKISSKNSTNTDLCPSKSNSSAAALAHFGARQAAQPSPTLGGKQFSSRPLWGEASVDVPALVYLSVSRERLLPWHHNQIISMKGAQHAHGNCIS